MQGNHSIPPDFSWWMLLSLETGNLPKTKSHSIDFTESTWFSLVTWASESYHKAQWFLSEKTEVSLECCQYLNSLSAHNLPRLHEDSVQPSTACCFQMNQLCWSDLRLCAFTWTDWLSVREKTDSFSLKRVIRHSTKRIRRLFYLTKTFWR